MSTDLMMYLSDKSSVTGVLKAACFAAEAHKNQRRKDAGATPYINHPLAVALLCLQYMRKDDIFDGIAIAQAAILHDVVEDTATTLQEIGAVFHEQVMGFVKEVTDDRTLSKPMRKRAQIKHILEISDAAQLIKLCDKLNNCQDNLANAPPEWSIETIQGYFAWSKLVVQQVWDKFPELKTKLEEVFNGQFVRDKINYPAIPTDCALAEVVEEYLASLEAAKTDN